MTTPIDALIVRLNAMSTALSGKENLKAAFTRIGILISSETKLNIRAQRLIDTGRLLNSISYKLFESQDKRGVAVGSYGIPYAAVHEFGYHGSVQTKAHMRMMNKAFGKEVKNPRQIQVRAHARFVNIRARPYLAPALKKHQATIIDILRGAITSG